MRLRIPPRLLPLLSSSLALILVTPALGACARSNAKGQNPSGSLPATSTLTSAGARGIPSTASRGSFTTKPDEGAGNGIDPMPGASATPVSTPPTDPTAFLKAVRAARQEGYDRVVFEFEKGLPGYDVRYINKPVRQDASGNEVPVAGRYVAQIRMVHASGADLTGGSLRITYTGPARLKPPTPEVAEVVRSGDFEGILTWVVGLRDRVDFRVSRLSSPSRLVADFRNH